MDVVIIIINDTVSVIGIDDLGISLNPSEQRSIYPEFGLPEINSSADLRVLITSGDIIINDGISDLSPTDGIRHVNLQTQHTDQYDEVNIGTVAIEKEGVTVFEHAKIINFAGGIDTAVDSTTGKVTVDVNDLVGSRGPDKVKVSPNDSTADYLVTKLVAGTNIDITENNDDGDETLTISATESSSGWLEFGDYQIPPLPSGYLKVIAGSTMGYLMPGSGLVSAISVNTNAANSYDYQLRKNETVIQTLEFSSQSTMVVNFLSLSFVSGDILRAYVRNPNADIDTPYTPDGDTLFLAHFEDETNRELRYIVNSSTVSKGMNGRLYGATIGTTGKFSNGVDFDGNDDFIYIHHHQDYNVQDCTIELFFNTDSVGVGNHCLFSKDYKNDEDGNLSFGLDGDEIYIVSQKAASTHSWTSSGLNISTGIWYHLMIVLGTGGIKVYLDGTSIYTNSWDQGLDGTKCTPITLGVSQDNQDRKYLKIDRLRYYFDGKIDEFRLSKVRRYETDFTAPTAAFTNDSNTLGLWHMDETSGGIVYDSSDTIHNAMLSSTGSLSEFKTDFVKYGSQSLKISGSANDWIGFIHNEEYEVTEFTVESWVRPHSSLTGMIFRKGDSGTEGGLQIKWLTGTNNIEVTYYGATTSRTITTATNSFPEDQYHHFSVAVDSTAVIEVFVDGILDGSENLTSDYENGWINNKEDVYIGASDDQTLFCQVYLDEFRISGSHIHYDNSNVSEITMLIKTE